jgi:hypothetical protein
MHGKHLVRRELRVEVRQQLGDWRRISGGSVEEELRVDLLLPGLDVDHGVVMVEHVEQNVLDRGWTDALECQQGLPLLPT